MSDTETYSSFSDPSKLKSSISITKPSELYSSKNSLSMFGIDVEKKLDDAANIKKVKSFMNTYSMFNPDNYDTKIDGDQRKRKTFLAAITDPKGYLSSKDQVAIAFENKVKNIRNDLFATLVTYRVAPGVARKASDDMANVLLNGLISFLNREMYPSEIESKIAEAALRRGGIKDSSSSGP